MENVAFAISKLDPEDSKQRVASYIPKFFTVTSWVLLTILTMLLYYHWRISDEYIHATLHVTETVLLDIIEYPFPLSVTFKESVITMHSPLECEISVRVTILKCQKKT